MNLDIPFIGPVQIGKVGGNLKHGVSLKMGYSGILSGEVGIRLDGNNVVLYWEFTAFGAKYKDEIVIFSI